MPAKAKNILIWIALIFLFYAIARNPTQAADVFRSIWDVIWGALSGLGQFFSNLAS